MLKSGPGINRKHGRLSKYIKQEYKEWMSYAQIELIKSRIKPFDCECIVHVDWYRPRKSGDVDNPLKPIMDCMEGYIYDNDKRIKRISLERFEDKKNPRYEIFIKKI